MRRIVIWLAATVTVVVLLLGYHTSTNQTGGATAPATAPGAAAPSSGSSEGSTTSGSGSAGSGSSGTGSSGSGGSGSAGSGSSGTGSSGSGGSGSGSSGADQSGAKTYTGSVAQTEWGPVQVEVTVTSGKVTAVDVVQYPDGNHRDFEINDRALPILVQETIGAQSAQIDMVSGATVTSDGYVRSLQSALDEAGI